MRLPLMARRWSWILVSAALAAAALVAVLALRGRDHGPDRVAGPTAPPPPSDADTIARPGLAPDPDPPADPPAAAPPPRADRASEQQRIALRALDLLDDAIARAEQRLDEAHAAGDAVTVRDLGVQLARLRAARQQRADALGE